MRIAVFVPIVVALVAGSAEAARSKPYMVARAPTMSLLGLMRRSSDGYEPVTELCGDGDSCSVACGPGYETCKSSDSSNHCYNPTAGDTCCSINSGDACETGYYCAHDSSKNTICCPNALDLTACAAALSPNGALTSDTPSSATNTASATDTGSSKAISSAATTSTDHATVTTSYGFSRPSTSSAAVSISASASKTASSGSDSDSDSSSGSPTGTSPSATTVKDSGAAGNKVALGLVAAMFVALL